MNGSTKQAIATRRALFVIGMHRSGTSALMRVLNLLGVELGAKLLPAKPGVNERGFFEHEGIYRVHNALLETIGSSWDDVAPLPAQWWKRDEVAPHRAQLAEVVRGEFGGQPLWGLKDPRLCKTLPLWIELLDELGIELCPIVIARDPDEVAGSIGRMKGFPAAKARALWLRHVIDAERATRGRRRLFVTYDGLLSDWSGVAARVAARFELSWPRGADAAAGEIEEFLDPALRHHHAGPAREPLDELDRWCRDAWQVLGAAAAGSADAAAGIVPIAQHFEAMLAAAKPLLDDQRSSHPEVRRLKAALTETKELAASRNVELARARAGEARSRSEAAAAAAQSGRLAVELARAQASLAAARASVARRHRVLEGVRGTLVWRLLCAWRALARRLRRRRR